MLDNEPTGGERTGPEPAGDTADSTAPARRPRTTRRKAAPPPAEAGATSEPGAAIEAVPAADARAAEPAAAEAPPPPTKATRRRRKAVPDAEPADGADQARPAAVVEGEQAARALDGAGVPATAPAGPAPGDGTAVGPLPETGPADAPPAEAAAPAKATRARRKKAVPPAAPADEVPPATVPVAAGEATAGALGAGPDVPPAGRGAAADLPGGRDAAAGADAPATVSDAPATVSDAPAGSGPAGASRSAAGTSRSAAASGPADADTAADAAQAGTGTAEPAPRTRSRRAAAIPPAVLFMPPEPEAVAPAPAARRSRKAAAAAPVEEPAAAAVEAVPAMDPDPSAEPAESTRRRRRGRRAAETAETVEPDEAPVTVVDEPDETADDVEDDEDLDDADDLAAGRRRRRRGRRGRGRGKGTNGEDDPTDETDEADETAGTAEAESDAEGDDEDEDEDEVVTRRRRRRRRKGSGDVEADADDGVHTVVKIREPRKSTDEVQGVSGSTRLEAKRQRRRDGREQRRTRPPILSESEFLARREAVDRVMVVRQKSDRTQIAVLEDGVLVEHYVTRALSGTMAGNVYLGKVQNVLPSMEAAFVDVGRGRNAVLYAGEVNWDATGLEGRARSIEQALKSGDSVLVQVTKDPLGHKGARLTSHIALSGRHLVYVPNGNASGISRKLPDNERKRLRDILKKLVPDGAGVIVRTAAEGATEDELARDVKRLQAQWEDIQAKAAEGGAPALLSEEPDLIIRVVRDLFNEDFRELVVQGDEAYAEVETYLNHVSPDLVERLHRHTGTGDVFAAKRIDEQILKGLDRKVFLPSGGHLVIDRTEAMTVVDVNTGKYTGTGGNLEETVTRNNLEAAEEIVRQLRLRDIGGIVVIDFIDMVLESNRDLVLRRLTECLGRDRTKHQVTEITSLGLVQMTRKRIGAGLIEAFSETCEHCKGRGVIVHAEPVPEKGRSGAGDRVKAVASAGTRAEAPTGRRRDRKAAAPVADAEPAVDGPVGEVPAAPVSAGATPVAPAGDYDDTMGYDLSRYEADTDPIDEPEEPMRLIGTDDPDAADGDVDEGDEPVGAGAAGRRRSRRGSTRRRTRP